MSRFLRSFLCTMLCLLLAISFFSPSAALAEYNSKHPERLKPEDIKGTACILVNASSGDVLFEKEPDKRMFPASTTKIMTVLVALEQCDDLDAKVPVDGTSTSNYVRKNLNASATVLGIQEGEMVPLIDLLYGTIMRSGCDSAIAVAKYVSGTEEAFVELMNTKAQELGMTGTHYVNSHGLHHPGHYTTARDLATLAYNAMQNELFAKIAGTYSYRMSATNMHKQRTIYTRHRIMHKQWNDEANAYYYKYITGIKSGTTSEAGYCYVGSASRDGLDLISVVLNSGTTTVWRDTKRLFAFGYGKF